ncbi:MAG: spore germination protein [Clostridia bacterium]|nr:spore germination protein [Clostridia bacterium]
MKLCTRQICFILLAYTAVSRMILYPTLLSAACGRDLLFPALIDFFVQGVIIWAVAFLCSKTDKTLFELLEGALGNIVARIVYGLFAAFFFLTAIIPLFEQKLYVHAIFYDTIPSLLVFVPFFFFSVYAGTKGFKNIGRSADICLPVFILAMLFIFVMALVEVKWDNFLPILKTPIKNIFGGSLSTLYRFSEPCWLLMFMGHFKYKKWDAAKITLSYAGGAAITLFMLFVFYGIYGELAMSRQFAISKISLFFPAIEMLGRIDLIALYILEIAMLFALVLNIQLTVHCVKKCTGYTDKNVISFIVNAALLIILVVCDSKFHSIHTVYEKWMWIVFVIFANVMPLLAWALPRRKKR